MKHMPKLVPALSAGPPNATSGNKYPVKECENSKLFVEHDPHSWHKKDRENWKFHCDGILPVDEQPPCQMYVRPDKPECGEPSPTKIRVRTSLVDATIDVCIFHKKQYDNMSAARRAGHAAQHKAS